MDWLSAIGFGAIGGGVIEALGFYGRVSAWQSDRHRARAANEPQLPLFRQYIDTTADTVAVVTKILLGACAGWLFHSEVTGMYAAVAVGASAPVLLGRLGAAQSVREAIQGGESRPEAADELAEPLGGSAL